MSPAIGPILTHTPSPRDLRAALSLARADCLKVVATHGLAGGWTAAAIAEVVAMTPLTIVRFRTGDPSYGDGSYAIPDARQALDEGAAWYRAAPERIVFEIGNEPRQPAPGRPIPDLGAYVAGLDAVITACRTMFPHARLLAPAHSLNDPGQDAEVARWLRACAPAYLRCDGAALHAYDADQARRGISLLRLNVGAAPVWLTEVNLGEELPHAERGRRIWSLVRGLPVEAALVYHLDQSTAPPSEAQGGAHYRLAPETLATLGMRDDSTLGAAGDPDTVSHPARIENFLMDIRQWRTVAAFRRHLARHAYAATARWAKGLVVHHTVRPTVAQWRGAASMLAMARFYRDEVDNGPGKSKGGWPSGPHLYVVSGSPDPRQDGIWQLTPLSSPGVHARAANTSRWGLEVVGDYTRASWPPDVAGMALGTAAALLDWAGLPVSEETISPHSQWGKPECPGAALDMVAVRRGITAVREGR